MAWHGEFLEIFLRNQMKLAPVMPLLVLFMAATVTLWVPWTTAVAWALGAIGCSAVQVYLCKSYFSRPRNVPEQRDWIGMIAASELFQGMFWVMPLFFFWPNSDSLQNTFLVAAIIAVSVVRLLIVSNFMPVLIAGTGVMTIGVAVRCVAEGNAIYLSLAGLIITLEVFYLFVARQLQDTLRDMIIFRQQKDGLIQELKAERDRADVERQKAENANRAKSSFLANMSHELRTPLNAILGYAQILLRDAALPDKACNGVTIIQQSGDHLLGLINDILDLAKIESDKLEVDAQPFELRHFLQGIAEAFAVRAKQKDLDFHMNADPQLPIQVWGDERKLRQILFNLIGNAIKFTDRGLVEVSLAAERDGDHVRLAGEVRDGGPGLPDDRLEMIFDPFVQTDNGREQGGAGLGLSICREIVRRMDGEIVARNNPGAGATFRFEVVLFDVPPEAEAERDALAAVVLDRPLHILIADDNGANRFVASTLCEMFGCTSEAVENGKAAVDAASSGRFDLVLMDIRMPVMDGLEATRAIRRLAGPVAATPILALTANADPWDAEHYRSEGMDGVIEKPIKAEVLAAGIQAAIAGRQACARAA